MFYSFRIKPLRSSKSSNDIIQTDFSVHHVLDAAHDKPGKHSFTRSLTQH